MYDIFTPSTESCNCQNFTRVITKYALVTSTHWIVLQWKTSWRSFEGLSETAMPGWQVGSLGPRGHCETLFLAICCFVSEILLEASQKRITSENYFGNKTKNKKPKTNISP